MWYHFTHETISMGKKNNIHYRIAYEHYRCGKILGAYQLETRTIIVPDKPDIKEEFVVILSAVTNL